MGSPMLSTFIGRLYLLGGEVGRWENTEFFRKVLVASPLRSVLRVENRGLDSQGDRCTACLTPCTTPWACSSNPQLCERELTYMP